MSNKTTIQFPQTVNFLGELDALNRETAKRAFALFQQRGYMNGWDVDDWLRAESEILRPVPIEMSESDDSFTIRAEVPGFDAKNLSIQADGNSVYIRGKNEYKKEEKGVATSNIPNCPPRNCAAVLRCRAPSIRRKLPRV